MQEIIKLLLGFFSSRGNMTLHGNANNIRMPLIITFSNWHGNNSKYEFKLLEFEMDP